MANLTNNTIGGNKAKEDGGGLVVKEINLGNSKSRDTDAASMRVDINSTVFSHNKAKNGGQKATQRDSAVNNESSLDHA